MGVAGATHLHVVLYLSLRRTTEVPCSCLMKPKWVGSFSTATAHRPVNSMRPCRAIFASESRLAILRVVFLVQFSGAIAFQGYVARLNDCTFVANACHNTVRAVSRRHAWSSWERKQICT